jgi:hypothetical protein
VLPQLILHHWKYHKKLTLAFIFFLTIFNFTLVSQTYLSEGQYYLDYSNYLHENQIDYIESFAVRNIDQSSFDKYSQLISDRDLFKEVKFTGYIYKKVLPMGSTIVVNAQNFSINQELNIGGIAKQDFSALNQFNLLSNLKEISDNGLIGSSLANRLLLNNTQKNQILIDIPVLNNPINFSVLGNFTWNEKYESELNNFDFILPLNTFLSQFENQSCSLHIFTQVERNTLLNPSPSMMGSNIQVLDDILYQMRYFGDVGEYNTTSYESKTTNFFYSYLYHINSDYLSLFVLILPSIVLTLYFGTILAEFWSRDFLEMWNFFKPKGMSLIHFKRSYYIYALSMVLIASIITFIGMDIIVGILYSFVFGFQSYTYYTNFLKNLIIPLFIYVIISSWIFYRGLKILNQIDSPSAMQNSILKQETNFSWGVNFILSGILLLIVFVMFPTIAGTFEINSIALEFWFILIFSVLIILIPILLIFGFAAFSMHLLPKLEKRIAFLLKNRVSISNPRKYRLGFFFILILGLQFSMIIAITTSDNSNNETNPSMGITYSTYFANNFNKTEIEEIRNKIQSEVKDIHESWIISALNILLLENYSLSSVTIYQYNASEIPFRLSISETSKQLLQEASNNYKGIVLNSGKLYEENEINIRVANNNFTIPLMQKKIDLNEITYLNEYEIYNEPYVSSIDAAFNSKNLNIGILVPNTVNLSSFNLNERYKIVMFSDTVGSQSVKNEIEFILNGYSSHDEQTDIYKYINLMSTSSSLNTNILSNELILILEIILINFIALFFFLFYAINDIARRKQEFGSYIVKGLGLSELRRVLLKEGVSIMTIALISAIGLTILLSVEVSLVSGTVQISKIINSASLLLFGSISILVLFFFSYMLILRINLKNKSLIFYFRIIR